MPPDIRAYQVSDDGKLTSDSYSIFATCTSGVFDGFESIDKEIFGPQLATVCIATRLMGP